MTDITTKLQDFQLSFDAYIEFTDPDSFYSLKSELDEFYDDHGDELDDLQEALYWAADKLADGAETYWKPIADQERMDYERDLRNDLSSQGNH